MFSCLQQAEEHNFLTSYSRNLGPVDSPIPMLKKRLPFLSSPSHPLHPRGRFRSCNVAETSTAKKFLIAFPHSVARSSPLARSVVVVGRSGEIECVCHPRAGERATPRCKEGGTEEGREGGGFTCRARARESPLPRLTAVVRSIGPHSSLRRRASHPSRVNSEMRPSQCVCPVSRSPPL